MGTPDREAACLWAPWGVALLVVTAFAMGLLHRPQVQQGMLLSDAVLRWIGAEYGTQCHAPQRPIDRLNWQLPRLWQQALGWSPGLRTLGPTARTNLCVWMEVDGPSIMPPALQYLLVDREGFEAAMVFDGPNGFRPLAGFGPPRFADVCAPLSFLAVVKRYACGWCNHGRMDPATM